MVPYSVPGNVQMTFGEDCSGTDWTSMFCAPQPALSNMVRKVRAQDLGTLWGRLQPLLNYRFVDAQESDIIGEASAGKREDDKQAIPAEHGHPS